jgi:hypothetical protein
VFDQLTGLPQQSRILELGCGPSWLWRHNGDRIPAGWRVVLTDGGVIRITKNSGLFVARV